MRFIGSETFSVRCSISIVLNKNILYIALAVLWSSSCVGGLEASDLGIIDGDFENGNGDRRQGINYIHLYECSEFSVSLLDISTEFIDWMNQASELYWVINRWAYSAYQPEQRFLCTTIRGWPSSAKSSTVLSPSRLMTGLNRRIQITQIVII